MKLILVLVSIAIGSFMFYESAFCQNKQSFETSDVLRFWEAVDSLKSAKSKDDSLRIIQTVYLDRMSSGGAAFIKVRKYTAPEYLHTLRKYPKYLKQLRFKTEHIATYTASLDSVFKKLKNVIPGYKVLHVCFAIGCFRGGGTTRKDLILIGSEIALADSTMDFSEFKGNLHDILSRGINLNELVAHESIHCQQHHAKNETLLSKTLQEGAANFLASLSLNHGRLSNVTKYELEHECELWKDFKPEMHNTNLSKWLFNAGTIKNRPADLGYFIGMRICEAYYNGQEDKQDAIKNLLDRRKYMEVMEKSGYNGNCGIINN